MILGPKSSLHVDWKTVGSGTKREWAMVVALFIKEVVCREGVHMKITCGAQLGHALRIFTYVGVAAVAPSLCGETARYM